MEYTLKKAEKRVQSTEVLILAYRPFQKLSSARMVRGGGGGSSRGGGGYRDAPPSRRYTPQDDAPYISSRTYVARYVDAQPPTKASARLITTSGGGGGGIYDREYARPRDYTTMAPSPIRHPSYEYAALPRRELSATPPIRSSADYRRDLKTRSFERDEIAPHDYRSGQRPASPIERRPYLCVFVLNSSSQRMRRTRPFRRRQPLRHAERAKLDVRRLQ